jgi:hypothetical protein
MAMRRLILIAVLLVPLCAGGMAAAQPFPGKGIPPDKGRIVPEPAKQADMDRAREVPGPARPVHERLSPEERRQLRRDIDQHGREVYGGRNR